MRMMDGEWEGSSSSANGLAANYSCLDLLGRKREESTEIISYRIQKLLLDYIKESWLRVTSDVTTEPATREGERTIRSVCVGTSFPETEWKAAQMVRAQVLVRGCARLSRAEGSD
jgi:hypothetical protein